MACAMRAASSPSAAATAAAAAGAPNTAVGWKQALWVAWGATSAIRPHDLASRSDALHDGSAIQAAVLGDGEHGRNDHRARMHRPPFERVVEILAVRRSSVDESGVIGAHCRDMADRGALARRGHAGEAGADIVGIARGNAQPGDIQHQEPHHLGYRRGQTARVDGCSERTDALGKRRLGSWGCGHRVSSAECVSRGGGFRGLCQLGGEPLEPRMPVDALS